MTDGSSVSAVPAREPGTGGPGSTSFPERPVISTPEALQPASQVAARKRRTARQPRLGFAGLLLVVPIAILFAFGAGSAERSLLVLGPIITFALPPVAMVAFWWDDWPGTLLRPAWWSGWFDTAFVAVVAIGLTIAGQAIVGRADLAGVFEPAPGIGHAATFPAVLPLAGAAFTAILQLTLVNEGWPLRRLPRIPGGLIALAVSWGVAIAIYYLVVDAHPAPGSGLTPRHGIWTGGELGALLTLIAVWQVWFYVTWRGWPFAGIRARWLRLVAANVVTIGGGWLTFAVIRAATDFEPAVITAAAGSLIAAGLVVSMLFEDAVRPHLSPAWDRVVSVTVIVALAAALYAGLTAYADTLTWTRGTPAEWVAHAALNSLAVSVILHVAIGRRWPFAAQSVTGEA